MYMPKNLDRKIFDLAIQALETHFPVRPQNSQLRSSECFRPVRKLRASGQREQLQGSDHG